VWSVLTICALAAIGASSLLWGLNRILNRDLQALTLSAESIARGEIQQARSTIGELPPDWGEQRDELTLTLHAMRIMNMSLSILLEQVLSAKNTVRSETDRVAGSVQMLQAVISQQAASIRQMIGTSNDILKTIRELGLTMEELNLRAGRTAESAASGISLLSSITTAIDRLRDAAHNLGQAREAIHEHSSRIDTVLNTILRVANRINILSLNASIEAETAGAAVRGFSAIAVQTRQLADQTAISALNIEQVIRDMQAAVREGSQAFEQHLTRTQEISGFMQQASLAMAGILEDTRAMADYLQSIHSGMQVQSESAGKIAEAAGQLLGAAEDTRESVGDLGLATEQLPAAVRALERELGRFQTSS
jgi:methyl-accepting chemotaxis protein WspA